MRITAVIKGDIPDAERKLEEHGLDARFLRSHSRGGTVWGTVWEIDTSEEDIASIASVLNHWLSDAVAVPGEGFPDGSLLIWSQHEK